MNWTAFLLGLILVLVAHIWWRVCIVIPNREEDLEDEEQALMEDYEVGKMEVKERLRAEVIEHPDVVRANVRKKFRDELNNR